MAWGRAKPSYTGTPWETPSPESMTIPVVLPEAYKLSTAWMATYMAGMLKVSNMIWVIFSLLALGLRGASVNLILLGSPRSAILMQTLVRTPDRHEPTVTRAPTFKPSNRTCLQVAGLQEPAKAPGPM